MPANHPWTPADDAALAAHLAVGTPTRVIAADMGHPVSVITTKRKQLASQHLPQSCGICDTPLTQSGGRGRPRKYCSPDCAQEAAATRHGNNPRVFTTTSCERCGDDIPTTGGRRYCSRTCQNQDWAIHASNQTRRTASRHARSRFEQRTWAYLADPANVGHIEQVPARPPAPDGGPYAALPDVPAPETDDALVPTVALTLPRMVATRASADALIDELLAGAPINGPVLIRCHDLVMASAPFTDQFIQRLLATDTNDIRVVAAPPDFRTQVTYATATRAAASLVSFWWTPTRPAPLPLAI